LEFASPRTQEVALDVYSVKGELVKTLFRGRVDQGVEQLHWQGDNRAGRRVSPGTYFMVFKGETRTLTETVVIQR
jgi:flagellar hook assembly protein FlgD